LVRPGAVRFENKFVSFRLRAVRARVI